LGAWADGTIYGWRPELDQYQPLLPAVFAGISVLYTIAESLLESLLECLLESLLDRLLESLLERASHWEE
jgi:hypothetical protein